jgi:hypothetical protein
MKKLITTLALCAMLAACAAPITPPPPPQANTTPADLSKQCPDIPHMDKPANLGDAVTYITTMQKQYTVCASRNDSLREVTTNPNQPKSSSQGK